MASIGRFVQRVTRGARLACSGVPITTGMHCSSRAYSLLSTSPLSAHRGTRFSKVIPLPITIARDLHDNTSTKLEIPIIYVSSKSFSRIEIDVKVNPKDSSMLLEDPNGYINLWKLFDERRDLCYEYTDKLNTMRCFSCFAIDIFKELFLVAAKEGQVADFFFKFDASQILVKWDSAIVEYIAIPASQFQTGKSIYADRVVGACTSLVYSLCRMRNGLNCKELLHLMELAQKKRLSVQEVLKHPLFWTCEDKYAAILAARIFVSSGKTNIQNPPNIQNPQKLVPPRIRSLTGFSSLLASVDYYEITLSVTQLKSGEFQVSKTSSGQKQNWEQLFIVSNAFSSIYRNGAYFGCGGPHRTVKLVIFARDILGHFGDRNMDQYVYTLAGATIRTAVNDLDGKFSLCLTIYDALRLKNLPAETMPLAVVP